MLYTYRLLYYWIFQALPDWKSPYNEWFYRRWWRKACYKLLEWIRPLRHWGKAQFLYERHPNSTWTEMQEEDFNRVILYVEGYLANIAYRIKSAPNPMPPGREERGFWGTAYAQAAAASRIKKAGNASNYGPQRSRRGEDTKDQLVYTGRKEDLLEQARRWGELARIYKQLTGDRFENPYWERWENPSSTDGDPLEYPDHVDEEKQEEIARKASRFDKVQRDRRQLMHERLQDIKSIMTYD